MTFTMTAERADPRLDPGAYPIERADGETSSSDAAAWAGMGANCCMAMHGSRHETAAVAKALSHEYNL
jgi:hypothetical protein